MYFTLEPVPKPTTCRRCRAGLARAERAISSWIYIDSSSEETKTVWYHPSCAVDLDPISARDAIVKADPDASDPTLSVVRAKAITRAEAVRAFESARAAIEAGESAAFPSVEPAVDARGRPRVRVRFGGSVSSGNQFGALFEELIPDWTFASSRREYVLAPHAATQANARRNDPSQPVVAAVYATPFATRIVAAQREKVLLWRAEGLPAPVLWIVGDEIRDPRALDKKALELRAMLSAAGFEADLAIVVGTAKIDLAAIDALGVALDELLDAASLDEAREALLQDSLTRALGLLALAFDEGRDEALAGALERADRAFAAEKSAHRGEPATVPSLIERLSRWRDALKPKDPQRASADRVLAHLRAPRPARGA